MHLDGLFVVGATGLFVSMSAVGEPCPIIELRPILWFGAEDLCDL
jgi:hypothetical protein